MLKGFFNVPEPKNEPVKSYAPGSPERESLQAAIKEARSKVLDIPMHIGNQEVRTDNRHVLAHPMTTNMCWDTSMWEMPVM